MTPTRCLERMLAGGFGLLGVLALVACSGSPRPKPSPLEAVTPQIGGRLVWTQRVDSVKFPLLVAVNETASSGGTFTVAGSDGTVIALQADTGRELWRASIGTSLSAGVGSDGRFASVVTRDNELVTLEAGRVLWRARLGARVATSPFVAGERVFVMSVDRVVQAFDALDGRKLWTLQRPGEPLTLSKAGVLGAFQNAVGCVNVERGTLVWTRNVGGNEGLGGDVDLVVGADGSDRISAWRAATGELAWTNDKLLYRDLSALLLVGRTAVFGDAEGNVHLLAREDGKTLLRLTTDGSPVVAPPALSGKTMLIVTRSGGLFAFRPE